MKILLSGGSGFIGKNFLKFFLKKNNHNILIVGRNLENIKKKKVKYLKFDLNKIGNNFEEIKKYNPDIFLHLAWEGIPNYSEEISKKNYFNTIEIIKMVISETSCQKIISTGSCWEYNDGNLIGECMEDQFVDPKKSFSIYKNRIFHEVYKICKDKKILFNWLRLFYVYGPGQRKDSIIPLLIDSFSNNKKINVNFPSNKNDFIFIDDVVKIIDKFIEENYMSGIYNVGSGKNTPIYELLKIIDNEVNGNDFVSRRYLNKFKLQKSKQNFYASTKKLKKYLKDINFTKIDGGIQKTIKNLKFL